jgi:beta-lactam-binding protein with PASTA domain
MLVRLFAIVCASVVAALALSGCQALPATSTQSTDTLTVPDVIGLTASIAQERLTDAGLDSGLTTGDTATSEADLSDPTVLIVVRVSPDPGSKVPAHSHVTVFVSRQTDPSPTPEAAAPTPEASVPEPAAPVAPAPAPPPVPSCPTGTVEFALISGWLSDISEGLPEPAYYAFAAGTVTNRTPLPVQVLFPPAASADDSAGTMLIPLSGRWGGGTPNSIPPGGVATYSLSSSVGYPEDIASRVTQFSTGQVGHNAAQFVSGVPAGCSARVQIVDAPPVPVSAGPVG